MPVPGRRLPSAPDRASILTTPVCSPQSKLRIPVGSVIRMDRQAVVDRLAADGYGLVGDIGQYEHIWRMAYVRGPEGIIVSLAERIG